MESLKQGDSGPNVVALQKQLAARGFSAGAADGNFGPGTTAAVTAFQNKQGLPADGVVGPQTAAALGLSETGTLGGMPAITMAVATKMFPLTPVANIQANLPHVLSSLKDSSLTDTPIVLAALATIRAETESFEPIGEGISQYNTSPGSHPFNLYDNRADLGNKGAPDGASFKGRGYVQLTGRANYTKFGPIIGVPDLVNNPDQASDPVIAANILAAFIASKADAINAALMLNDYAGARRLVNGGSNGLDRFTAAYTTGFNLIGSA